MILMKIGHGRYLNMDLLIDAEIVDIEAGVSLAILRFAGPWEQAVYREGPHLEDAGTTVVPYEVCLRGEPAAEAHRWLDARWALDQPIDLDPPTIFNPEGDPS